MKIGMIQMDAAAGHMEHNIAHGFELMEEAAEHSDLVVMPELWTIGYNFHDLDKKAIQEKDSLLQKLRNLARTFGVTLIPGTLPVMKRGKIYNTAYVIGPDGEIQGSYSKRHLFHEYLESKLMEPGDLVFFTTYNEGVSHSGIYVGNGNFISATTSNGIALANMKSGYWFDHYVGAKRVL